MKQDPSVNLTHLTQSQLLIWTGQELNPEIPLYNVIMEFEFTGAIDIDGFTRAFKTLVEQSDAMRTVFQMHDGVPMQQVMDKLGEPLEILDFSEELEKETLLKQWIENHNSQNFKLSKCAFKSALIKMGAERYVWYLNQHHLITDAWGVTTQYEALSKFYQNSIADSTVDFYSLPEFKEFITYEQKQCEDAAFESITTYWEDELKNSSPAVRLYGYSDQVLNTSSERITIELGAHRTNKLRALANEPEIKAWTDHLSLYNIFATLLFSYLYRVSGQQNLCIGTPAHNRSTNRFKNTPGVFIQLYPLFSELKPGITFTELHQQVREKITGFMINAVPGINTAKASRSFQVVLNYIHASFGDFNGIPMTSKWQHPNHSDQSHYFRLQIHDFDNTGSLRLDFDLNTQIFDKDKRPLVPGHFLKLLDAFLEDRFQSIDRPSIVSDDEFLRLIDKNVFSLHDLSSSGTVLDLFQEQVSIRSSDQAIIHQDEVVSYSLLDEKSNQLANYLLKQGIGPGDRVVLYLDRSIELIVSILGVLKSGAIYVPIDTNFPMERIAFIIENLNASAILSYDQKVPGGGHQPIYIDMDHDLTKIEACGIQKPEVSISMDDLAYIMYTSGTTGKPKGVKISHSALSNYILFAQQEYLDDDQFSFSLFTTPAFDLTVTSIFLPLVSGGNLIIYSEPETGPDMSFLEVIEQNLVDIVKVTPSHMALLGKERLENSRIKKIIVGGEDFKSALAHDIVNIFGEEVEIYNEYGPTEATVGCVVHKLQVEDLGRSSVPIGKPIRNMAVYLLDSEQNPVPNGVAGEIYLAGAGIADGYWGSNDITQQRFIDNPFAGRGKMYQTGDLARWDNQYNLEYLGRKDRQVKIGGIRIEPGEIEGVLLDHPGVDIAAVDLRQLDVKLLDKIEHCTKCGLPSNYPSSGFDEHGVCELCRSFENYQQKAQAYFREEQELMSIINEANRSRKAGHHCIMLLSGGKDSTYALARLVEMGFKVLAFTLDNGYISDQAKSNIKRVVKALDVDHIFGKTEAMNAIFVDSLKRYCNVCNGCFKTIYTLSTKLALEKGIPVIVTGLSRGQFFETRLTEELFRDENVDFAKIDQTILEARKAYHRTDDAVNRLLDVTVFDEGKVFDQVKYVDFYRFCDVSLDQMLRYLDQHLPWVRPTDTGRSTNCTINQVGIYEHKKRMGYSNYAFPYSWDVRMGHKTRDASLEEVNEEIDETEVRRIMDEIGYKPGGNPEANQLVAYFTGESGVSEKEFREYLESRLPEYMIPVHFIRLSEIPLTRNGKIDYRSLPGINSEESDDLTIYRAPETQVENILVGLWSEVLQRSKVGADDNFIHIGGNSLAAIRLMSRINEAFHLDIPLNKIFEFPSVAVFGRYVEETIDKLLEQEEGTSGGSEL